MKAGYQEAVLKERSKTTKQILSKFGIFLILVGICVIGWIVSPVFFTSANLLNIVRSLVVTTVMACGMTMLIIAGLIDLSAGSVVALTGCVTAIVVTATQSIPLAILAGMAVGLSTGIVSGAIIALFNIPPFITTLGMMMVARGIALSITGGQPVTGIGDIALIGSGYLGAIPVPVIILVIILVISWTVLNRTQLGRHLFAIGGNEEAARASGINIKKTKVFVCAISGMLTGLAGIILMARVNSGQPGAAEGYEFDAITAAVVGGTSFTGGIGSIGGTLIGALIVGVLNNIMNLTNVSSYTQQILRGIIIVVAVVIDIQTKRKKLSK